MKKLIFSSSLMYVFIIILISVLTAFPLLVMKSSAIKISGALHFGYIIKLDESIREGIFFPRWISNSTIGKYGSPRSIFYPPLCFYISELFVLANFGFINAMKITLFLSFLLSGITMYLFMRNVFDDDLVGFISAIAYMLSIFCFFDFNYWDFLPQNLAFIFLPLILWSLSKTYEKKLMRYFVITSISFALLILEHIITALIFTPIMFIYLFCLFFWKKHDKKGLFYGFASILIGIGLASFFWFPALVEFYYTYFNVEREVIIVYLNISQFLDDLSLIQKALIFAFSVTFFTFLLKRSHKLDKNILYLSLFSILILIVTAFMYSSLSGYLWKIELIKNIEYPWRFNIIGVLSTSIMSGVIISIISKYKINKYKIILSIIFIFLIILFTIPNVKVAVNTLTNDDFITCNQFQRNNIFSENFGYEFSPIWVNEPLPEFKQRVEIINGSASVESFEEKSQYMSFSTESNNSSKILINEFWYPGWTGYVNKKKVSIDRTENGLISLNLPKGYNQVELKFENTEDRNIGDLFSLFTIIVLLILVIKKNHSVMVFASISVIILIIIALIELTPPIDIVNKASYFKNIKYPIATVPILNDINESNLERVTYGDNLSEKTTNQCYVGCDNADINPVFIGGINISNDFMSFLTMPISAARYSIIEGVKLSNKNKYVLVTEVANSVESTIPFYKYCGNCSENFFFQIKIFDCSLNSEENIYEDVINKKDGWKTISLDISKYANKSIIFELYRYPESSCDELCVPSFDIKKFYIGKVIR